jgi:hypothetical protein
VLVVVVLMAESPKKHETAAPTTTTTRPAPKIPRLTLRIGKVSVQNVGPPAQVHTPVRRELLHELQRYVDDAIIAPLEHGRAVKGYGKMFDPGVSATALGRDLAVLTEAKMGFRHNPVRATASPVRLDAIGGSDGRPALVAATFAIHIDTPTTKGYLAIRHHAELTFAPEFGGWLVTAYQANVERSLGHPGENTKSHARAG